MLQGLQQQRQQQQTTQVKPKWDGLGLVLSLSFSRIAGGYCVAALQARFLPLFRWPHRQCPSLFCPLVLFQTLVHACILLVHTCNGSLRQFMSCPFPPAAIVLMGVRILH